MISGAVNAISRRAILAAAESETLRAFVRRHGMRFGAKRFVAGETFASAVPVLRALNERGLLTNTTLLGEGVREPAETRAVVEEYKRVLDGIHRENLRTNVAIKPTHLGLALDEELAYENVAALAAHAAEHGNFVRMDMEESRYVDPTLAVYRRLRAVGGRQRRHRLAGIPLPNRARPRRALAAPSERADLQGRVPGASGGCVRGEA